MIDTNEIDQYLPVPPEFEDDDFAKNRIAFIRINATGIINRLNTSDTIVTAVEATCQKIGNDTFYGFFVETRAGGFVSTPVKITAQIPELRIPDIIEPCEFDGSKLATTYRGRDTSFKVGDRLHKDSELEAFLVGEELSEW